MQPQPTTKQRKTKALKIAATCAQLLEQKFGAQRVLLFGSLVGNGVWHEHSDIDLAVEGLAPADFFPAYSACTDISFSHGLDLDLVPLEDAYPEMRARILREVEMPQDPLLALKALVEDELVALERVTQEMHDLLNECTQPPTHTELRAMAGMLHEFYNGIESIFERITIRMGESLPRGEHWHTDLLNQMAEAQGEKRPAVLDGPLHTRLKEYLKFRHFFRHAYGYTLTWDQMKWQAEGMPETLVSLQEQLRAFFQIVTAGSENDDSLSERKQ